MNLPTHVSAFTYRHCEYQSLEYLHVLPDAQAVHPVHPLPPHWPYKVCVHEVELAEAELLVVVLELLVVVVDALDVVVVATDVELLALDVEVDNVVADELELELEPPPLLEPPPGPETLVVKDPLSIYTPEKYKSSSVSAYPSRGNSRTPRCQSAPLLLVLALMGETVSTRSSAPVECQKPTVPAEKSISVRRMGGGGFAC